MNTPIHFTSDEMGLATLITLYYHVVLYICSVCLCNIKDTCGEVALARGGVQQVKY